MNVGTLHYVQLYVGNDEIKDQGSNIKDNVHMLLSINKKINVMTASQYKGKYLCGAS